MADSALNMLMKGNPNLDLLSKNKLFQRVKSMGVAVTKKAFDAWFEDQKDVVHKLYAKQGKQFKQARLADPPYSFMIDTVQMPRYKRQN